MAFQPTNNIHTNKKQRMKKTILAVVLMIALASCNNGAKVETPVVDSTAVVAVDTIACPIVDSVATETATQVK